MIDQIANELIIASLIMHTNNVSRIASEIGYRPLLIITALYRGEETGKFKYNEKNDTITIGEGVEVETLAVTEGMSELIESVEQFMGYLNAREKDMSIDEMRMLLGGLPDLHIKIAVDRSKKLASYDLADPKDKKSSYTFITLAENIDKKYGAKQFDAKNSKAKKHAKELAK